MYSGSMVLPGEGAVGISFPIWKVALGVHQGGWEVWSGALLFVLLLIYNVARFWLTLQVAPLRDAEERSGVTPALVDYVHLYETWHRPLAILGTLAVAVLIYNAIRFAWWFITADIIVFGP